MTKGGSKNSTKWRIGELAESTGLTVRTLHHYEDIGLLRSRRSEANHRYYNSNDIRRLYKILALKDLGLSLEDIARTLDGDQDELGLILASHLRTTSGEIERLTRLQMSLRHVHLLIESGAEANDLIQVIEAMSRVHRHVAKKTPPGEDNGDMGKRWRLLGEDLRACLDAGKGPETPATFAVAKKIRDALVYFSQGDESVLTALAYLRAHAPPQNLAGWDPPLFEFLDLALQALERKEVSDD